MTRSALTLTRVGFLHHFFRLVRGSAASLLGSIIVAVVLAVTAFSPLLAPHDPQKVFPGEPLSPPSITHWFGTDASGLDIFSRVVTATRTDIPVALAATAVSMVIGVTLGILTGYFGGRGGVGGVASEFVLRLMDVLQAFPVFVLAMVMVAASGPSAVNVGIAIAFVNIPIFMRLTRGQILGLRDMPFIEAARCAGGSPLRIAFVNALPNVVSPALIQASVTAGYAILLTAGLSFIGAGVRAPTPEWGLMIATGSRHIVTGQWWPSIFPGLALGLTVFGFALTGQALGRALDPLQRR